MTNIRPLRQPSRSMIWREITTLDGRPFASAGFTHDGGAIWEWISETVAHELGCDVDAVKVLETEDGDVLTVDGVPAYKLC